MLDWTNYVMPLSPRMRGFKIECCRCDVAHSAFTAHAGIQG